jgi:DNA-binding response OmpR family regulator
MATILVVEDEPGMFRGLVDNLEAEGYEVVGATDGEAGLERILEGNLDLVLLDVMLPRLSGFDVLKKARQKGVATPVIMLTAKGEEIDRVLGLELGADDYVTKPFSLRELLARVKAVLRRGAPESSAQPLPVITVGEVTIDFGTYTARRGETSIAMTPKEFEIVKFLWQHKNETVRRDDLLTEVWGYDESVSTRTIDNFILKLRSKIEADPSRPRHIITIHGAGYKLVP